MSITASTIGTTYQVSTADYNTRYEARIYLKVNSQSITDNTSSVTVWWTMKKVAAENYNAYCSTSSSKVTLSINSTSATSSGTTAAWDLRTDSIGTEITLYSRTVTISHDTDGSKTIPVSGYHVPGNSWDTLTLSSVDVILPSIARASSISSVTSSISMTGSNAVTVAISRASTSFTHTVKFSFGSYSQSYTSVATSQSYTIPLTWNNSLPCATSGTATVTVTTYSGTTQIGSSVSKTFTVTVPSTIVPSFTALTLTRVDGTVPSSWATYVQGKSKVTAAITGASGSYSSTISSYSIIGGGYTSTESSFTTGYLLVSGTNTFTAKITDSRGRTASKSVSITVYEYTNPSFNVSTIYALRSDSSGTADPSSGTYVKVYADYSVSSCNSKNTATATATINGTSYSISDAVAQVIGAGAISILNSYTVTLVIADYFTSTSQTLTVASAKRAFTVLPDNAGVGIGGIATEEDTLEVFYGNTKIDGDLTVTNGIINNYRGSSGDCDLLFEPGNYSISTDSINAPCAYGLIEVKRRYGDSGAVFQTAYSSYVPITYRFYWSTSWTDCKTITLS